MPIPPQVDQEELVRRWNCRWQAGRRVSVTKEICRGETRGPAFMKDGEAVVMVDGLCGPAPLTSVCPFPSGAGPFALDIRLGLAPEPSRTSRETTGTQGRTKIQVNEALPFA